MTQRSLAGLGMLVLLALLGGCASQPITHKDPRDPWERINRSTYNFDVAFVHSVARPVGNAYTRVTPQFVRTGIANFFDNTQTPGIIVNNLLQAKFKAGFTDIGRLLLNTTVGLGGLLDPATAAGLPKDENDFGRTLGTWGVHSGPYLVLPFLGPSDIRDGLGKIPDGYFWPVNYVKNTAIHYGIEGVYLLDTDVRTVLPSFALLESQNAFDPYGLMRNAYLQRREYLIHGQSSQSEEQSEQDLEKELDESGADDTSSPPPKQ